MIEDHGGRIEVSSTVGRGTTFVVLLPYDRPRPESAQS
jgi:signal transduction histidine kinase